MTIKRFLPSRIILTTLVTTAFLTTIPCTSEAQEVPPLEQEMPYSQARKLLLEAGWQAISIPWNDRESELTDIAKYLIEDLEYDELVNCSGTGLGLCRFEFSDINRQTLVIMTSNNEVEPELYRWWIEAQVEQ